jgi:hypothetical protein
MDEADVIESSCSLHALDSLYLLLDAKAELVILECLAEVALAPIDLSDVVEGSCNTYIILSSGFFFYMQTLLVCL